MQSSILTAVFLPVALGIIMFGLGLALTAADFKRVFLLPKAVVVGLFCQMFLLPVACFFLCKTLGLSPELSVGMMLLSASPGGATANLFSHLAHGDVALNITLTAVNSLLSLFTLPLIVGMSVSYFIGADQSIPMPIDKVVQVFLVILIPVVIGMFMRKKNLTFSQKMEKPVKILSALFMIIIIVAAVLKDRANLGTYFAQIGLAAFLFNIISLGVGYFVPLMLKLDRKQAIAISMEIGIHNGTLDIAIAFTVLGNSTIAIPAAIYGLVMFFTAGAFTYWINNGQKKEQLNKSKAIV